MKKNAMNEAAMMMSGVDPRISRPKKPNAIPIEEDKELEPGMIIAEDKDRRNWYRVVHAERYRDGLVCCLDDCGHTVLVEAWDGKHVLCPDGITKYRVAYGKVSGGHIWISDEYYFNEEDFRHHYPASHFWYVEMLDGTAKFVPFEKPPTRLG